MNHLEALSYANEVRARRSRLKRSLATGKTTLSAVLRADKCWLYSMKVGELLRAVPGMGDAKVRRALHKNHLVASSTLEHFPMKRREELLAWLVANHRSLTF